MGVTLESWFRTADAAVASFLRTLAFRPHRTILFLLIVCAALYLPGIATLPVTDRDEARFAQATKQMLETGDYVDIWFQDTPRHKKPIGIYWLQAASVSIASKFGAAWNDIWAYRIPSFLGATLAVLLTFWTAAPIIGRQAALVAAVLFASCLTLAFEARIAKSDAALIGSLMVTQGAVFRLYMARQKPGRWLAMLFWAGLGASILIKGPIGPALVIFTLVPVLVFDKNRNWLSHLHWRWGIPLLLAITLPWFVAIGISTGGAFFQSSLGQDFATKMHSGQEKHWGPPGFYLLLFWWTFWPAVLLISVGAIKVLWRSRHRKRVLFLLAWAVPFWVMLEIIPTKLPHYALPLYPAFAMASALVLFRPAVLSPVRYTKAAWLWGALAAFNIVAVIAALWFFEAEISTVLPILLVTLAALSIIAVHAARRSLMHLAVTAAVLSGVVFYMTAFRYAVPALRPVWFSQDTLAARQNSGPCSQKPVILAGFSEPSAVFYNGTKTLLASGPIAAEKLASSEFNLAFVSMRNKQAFEDRFQRIANTAPPRVLGCVDGLNINGRGPTRLYVYGKAGPDACVISPPIECTAKETSRWRRLLHSPF